MKKTLFITCCLFLISNTSFAQVDSTSAIIQQINTLEADIDRLQSSIYQLENELGNTINKSESNKIIIDSLRTGILKHDSLITSIQNLLESLSKDNVNQNAEISSLNSTLENQNQKFDSLFSITEANAIALSKKAVELTSQIEEVSSTSNNRISSLDTEISNSTTYWIIAFLLTIILSVGVFVLLRKRISSNKSDLDNQILDTKKSLEQEGINLDNKLVEVLERQLKLMDQKESDSSETGEEDHSLALKVADEISRIQMNLNHMDPNTKGIKRLDRAVQSIIDNFNAKGYEIPKLLNKPFDSGMNMVATMEPDEELEEGEEYIKRVIKPQVNYNGKMIQAAEVVVAFGE